MTAGEWTEFFDAKWEQLPTEFQVDVGGLYRTLYENSATGEKWWVVPDKGWKQASRDSPGFYRIWRQENADATPAPVARSWEFTNHNDWVDAHTAGRDYVKERVGFADE